jgi:hypothetical protein
MRPVLHEKAAAPLFAVLAKTNRRIYQEHRFTLSENENRNLGTRGRRRDGRRGQSGARFKGGGGFGRKELEERKWKGWDVEGRELGEVENICMEGKF